MDFLAAGGMAAEDKRFIEEHTALVRSVARKLCSELDLQCDLDDLMAYGFRGLVEARERFDPSRGVQFNTFAYYRVRGAVLDGVRQMAWMPRRAYARMRAAEAADSVAEEVASARAAAPGRRQGLDDTLETLHGALGRIATAYACGTAGDRSEVDPSDGPEEQVANEQHGARVRDALKSLPERERALVQGFYFQGRRFDEVAAELGISKSWASRLHSKALDLLRQQLAGADEPEG